MAEFSLDFILKDTFFIVVLPLLLCVIVAANRDRVRFTSDGIMAKENRRRA